MKLFQQRIGGWYVTLILAGLGLAATVCLPPPPAAGWGRGHLYVIGAGPAGPRTATVQALETLERMDVIVAPEKHVALFAEYVGEKPVLFDPWTDVWDYKGKSMWKLKPDEVEEFRKERFRIRDQRVKQIRELLAEGKDVGLMEYGNPCLYGPSHWYSEQFDSEDVIIIPGMGCDAAAMAALGKSTIPADDARFVIQTSPFSLLHWGTKEQAVLKDLSKYSGTLIFYMFLWKADALFEALAANFPEDLPCAVVFWAGYPDRERVLRGTIGTMKDQLAAEKEKYMGILFVGRFLEDKPYEKAMKRAQKQLTAGS